MEKMPQTFQVHCPCECGEEVTATDEGFHATSVEVAACSAASARGVASWTLRKTAAYERAVMVPAAVRHVEGVVWMVG